MPKRTAVILFNMGGPDSTKAIRPFLYNLFSDPDIIGLPYGLRHFLALVIATKRFQKAKSIYEYIGGKSPILEETKKQAKCMDEALNTKNNCDVYKTFIAMRYWHPFAEETVIAVKNWHPDEILLLPLYPHYSKTTTGSFLKNWKISSKKAGLNVPTKYIRDYHLADGFINAQADILRQSIKKMDGKTFHVLFSAHGLPESVIQSGDPYEEQIRSSALSIAAKAGLIKSQWSVTFQSRIGPKKWIGPFTDEEIKKFLDTNISLIILPISFVSEHVETLVELDIEYRELAKAYGIDVYERIRTVGCHPVFIEGLANLVINSKEHSQCMNG